MGFASHKKCFAICAAFSLWLGGCATTVDQAEVQVIAPTVEEEAVPESRLVDEPVVLPDDTSLRVAVLLPLSGSLAETGQAMLGAATMALFDAYDPGLTLLPFDTRGHTEGARQAVQQALDSDIDVILGPLLRDNVVVVAKEVEYFEAEKDSDDKRLVQIGFSNDRTVAGPGRYLLGLRPDDEVRRVIDYAQQQGYGRFASLAPLGPYGDQVQSAFGQAVGEAGAELTAFERFEPHPDGFDEPVRVISDYDRRKKALQSERTFLKSLNDDLTDDLIGSLREKEVLGSPPFDAILLAEGGERLKGIAPLLPFYEVDPKEVRVLGTGLWNDPDILKEPPLQGAWFAAPDPGATKAFMARFQKDFGYQAPRIVTLAYDGMALIAALHREGRQRGQTRLTRESLERPEGFLGLDGLFRFHNDGLCERSLAVIEVRRRGFEVIDPAPTSFPQTGFAQLDQETNSDQ